MSADETDPNPDAQSAPKPSVAPEPAAAPPAGDTELAPAPVESEGLADLLADPEIAPAEESTALADLLAPPAEAAPAEETPGLAELLASPDPAAFGEAVPAPGRPAVADAEGSRTPVPVEDPAPLEDPGPASGLPPLPALPPERPAPPLAPEGVGGNYPLLVGLVFLFLVVLLVGAIVLIAVLIGNAAWPFPIAAAALPAVLPLV